MAVFAVVYAQRRGRTGGAGGDYGAPPPAGQAQYGGNGGGQSSPAAGGGDDHQGLDWLLKSVPGQPGTDYPIFAEVPETGFGCEGQVEGGESLIFTELIHFSLIHISKSLIRISCPFTCSHFSLAEKGHKGPNWPFKNRSIHFSFVFIYFHCFRPPTMSLNLSCRYQV